AVQALREPRATAVLPMEREGSSGLSARPAPDAQLPAQRQRAGGIALRLAADLEPQRAREGMAHILPLREEGQDRAVALRRVARHRDAALEHRHRLLERRV